MYHVIIEQTRQYKNRMTYNPEKNTFIESDRISLGAARHCAKPYGWLKESGTPPDPHWDVILMSDSEFELGDEVEIKLIGVFIRHDGDHKLIAVTKDREIDDYIDLPQNEKEELHRLYPRVGNGEGWFGKKMAEKVISEFEKPL